MNLKKIIEKINYDGFYIIKNGLAKHQSSILIKRLKKLKPKVYLPNTNIPWGYGNLMNDKEFGKILENKKLNGVLEDFFKKKYHFNHLLLQNKAPWIGPSVEWHQEIFNIKTYAPGNSVKDWKKFLNIYIAIERQDLRNGCLKILKGSHKLGKLPYEDIMNEHFSHKRSVKYNVLLKISKKYKQIDCIMNPGDILIFNHLLVHGSPSNGSTKSRKSIVLQAQSIENKNNLKIFEKETKFRKKFILDKMKNKINLLIGKNIYKDFNIKRSS